MTKRKKRPKAGEAFAKAAGADRKTRAAWQRVQRRLRAVAVAMEAMRQAEETTRPDREAAWAELREEHKAAVAEWETETGRKYPRTVEEIGDYAAEIIAGDFAAWHAGNYTLAELDQYRRGQARVAKAADTKTPTAARKLTRAEKTLEWLCRALSALKEHLHDGWTDADIARKIGVAPSTLSRNRGYRNMAEQLRAGYSVPKGYKTKNAQTGHADDVEAYDYREN